MTANNNNKSYLGYLNKQNIVILIMVQLIKKLTNADYVALTEEIERIIKLLNVVMEPVLLSIRMLLVKVTQKIGRKKYL